MIISATYAIFLFLGKELYDEVTTPPKYLAQSYILDVQSFYNAALGTVTCTERSLYLNAQFPCHPVLYSREDIEYHKRSRAQLRQNVRSCGLLMFPDAAQEVPRIEHRDMQRRMMAYRKCPAWLGRVLIVAMSRGLALSSLLHEMIATAAVIEILVNVISAITKAVSVLDWRL